MITLYDLCADLRNWFDRGQIKYIGDVTIDSNSIVCDSETVTPKPNQYFRIIGSVFNDGVYQHNNENLIDEQFEGAVWLMAVPPQFLSLLDEMNAWIAANQKVMDGPYQSESYNGYSYSKASITDASGHAANGAVNACMAVFASRLNKWRKI